MTTGRAVLAVWVVAPLAVLLGVLAAANRPGGIVAAVVAFAVLGGMLVAPILLRPGASPRRAAPGNDGL